MPDLLSEASTPEKPGSSQAEVGSAGHDQKMELEHVFQANQQHRVSDDMQRDEQGLRSIWGFDSDDNQRNEQGYRHHSDEDLFSAGFSHDSDALLPFENWSRTESESESKN